MYKRSTVSAPMIICLVWGAIICCLSLMPSPPEVQGPLFGWDKLQHAAAYAVLAVFALVAFDSPEGTARAQVRVIAAVMLFGGAIELAQRQFTHTRSADLLDFVANGAGASTALILYRMHRLVRRPREERK